MTSGPAVLLGAEQQPEEHRDAEQPQHRQRVREGPHPVGQVLAVHDSRARRSRRGTGTAADGPFDDVTLLQPAAHRARG